MANKNKTSSVTVKDVVNDKTQDNTYNPYRIAKALNGVLAELQIKSNKTGELAQVRPQMLYNYDRNGLIVNKRPGKKQYTQAEVRDWITRYVEKNFTTSSTEPPQQPTTDTTEPEQQNKEVVEAEA